MGPWFQMEIIQGRHLYCYQATIEFTAQMATETSIFISFSQLAKWAKIMFTKTLSRDDLFPAALF